MKKLLFAALISIILFSCNDDSLNNTTAKDEQKHTEANQRNLFEKQPPPTISWSLERDNLTKRFKLQNDRSVSFYMYVFIEGISEPIGYYQVNKISSVNSQLTATQQLIRGMSDGHSSDYVIESPAEDGSYGTNGNGVFGFTPEDIYIETNMKYITSTVPLTFKQPVNRLAIVTTDEARAILENSKKAMK